MDRIPSLAAVRAEITRRRCRTLSGFIREAWHVVEPANPYVHGWHVDAICAHLEAITRGDISRLLINVPPGTMKSLLTGVLWPAWEWGPCGLASKRYLTTSYSDDLVKRDARRMRDLVRSDWYQAHWPIQLVRAGETSFANTSTGWREGVAFGSLTGGRADVVVIDDPHSTEMAESEAERVRTTRIFTESVPSRLVSPEKSAIVVIMQRLHQADVSGVIMDRGFGYDHLMLPMEFDPARRGHTSIGFTDPRTEDGDLLFPERFPRNVVDRDKKIMGSFAVAGQFQQSPTVREGGLFKRHWFEIVDAIPSAPRKFVRAWDLAATRKTAGNNPDWTVGLLVSRGASGIFYVENEIRFQGSPGEVSVALSNSATGDPKGTVIRIPQDPGQAGKMQAETFIRMLAGRVVTINPVTGDKTVRAQPAAVQAEAGNIKLARGPWNEAFIEEVCGFPGLTHDDRVDALSDAVNELSLGRPAYSLSNLD